MNVSRSKLYLIVKRKVKVVVYILYRCLFSFVSVSQCQYKSLAKKFVHTASREPRLRTYPYLLPCFLGLVNTESSLTKQPTFGNATTGFPAKWRLRNERRNFILMTRHYLDLGSASDWLNQIFQVAQPIRSTLEFLRSFLGCHLAGKPVVVSPNVGCFLRLYRK